MAYVNFSNLKVVQTFTSPHSMNAWGLIETQPYRKVQQISTDGTTNMFIILNAAKASGRTVSGSYDDATGMLYTLYLN
jgi:hypothetical protein